jgi:hypothetical protein
MTIIWYFRNKEEEGRYIPKVLVCGIEGLNNITS